MGIEIRQLVVKMDVVEDGRNKAGKEGVVEISGLDPDVLREEILADCKEWLFDRCVDRRER